MIVPGVSQVFLTNDEWTTLNPVVPAHVTAISIDTGTQKVGDGVKTWSQLIASGEGGIAGIAIQSNRSPVDNEGLVMCSAQNKWVFRSIGCFLTQTECSGMALTVYPKYATIIEIGDVSGIGTGRIKIGDGTTSFVHLPWIGMPDEYTEHLSDMDNPHNVTAEQLGLDNVTNDAQLTRLDGDFSLFSPKSELNPNDVILIEDSESSGQKKTITIGQIEEMIISYVIALGGQ